MGGLRIAVVTSDYPRHGSHVGAFVQARVDLYRRMGHDVDVYARGADDFTNDPDDPDDPEGAAARGFARSRLRFNTRRDGYDVVAVHIPNPDFSIPLVEPIGGVPTVAYVHGAEGIRVPLRGLTLREIAWRVLSKARVLRFLNRCDAVVTESDWMAEEIRRYFGRRSPALVHVIPNPVDPELFPFIPREDGVTRGLCLRGRARKYGADLVDSPAVDVLEPVYPRSVLAELLRGYGFFVAPSRLEGQGLMACEAAATGMPVATTDAGGIPEFLCRSCHVLTRAPPTRRSVAEAVARARALLPLDVEAAALRRREILNVCGPWRTVDRDLDLFREVS